MSDLFTDVFTTLANWFSSGLYFSFPWKGSALTLSGIIVVCLVLCILFGALRRLTHD